MTFFRSPDPENVYDVLYNENLDLLEPFADEYKIMNTEDGNIFLAGTFLIFSITYSIRVQDSICANQL